MRLIVPFNIRFKVRQPKQNFTGLITLYPDQSISRTFYFMVLRPYETNAEICICNDENMEKVYAEGVCGKHQGYNFITGLPIPIYDFGIDINDHRCGPLFILTQIIAEAIYQSESSGLNEFKHHWESDVNSREILDSFIQTFPIKR